MTENWLRSDNGIALSSLTDLQALAVVGPWGRLGRGKYKEQVDKDGKQEQLVLCDCCCGENWFLDGGRGPRCV